MRMITIEKLECHSLRQPSVRAADSSVRWIGSWRDPTEVKELFLDYSSIKISLCSIEH